MAGIPHNPDLSPRNPFLSHEDARRMVIDREIFGVAMAETTYDADGLPLSTVRVPPRTWLHRPPVRRMKRLPIRLKRRKAGAKRRAKVKR